MCANLLTQETMAANNTEEKEVHILHQEHGDPAVALEHNTEALQKVVDSEAAGYVDPTVVITSEEDKSFAG